MRIGYFLSTEEFTPAELVEQAVLAEEADFDALWISDHFHPWNDEQGQSPFVWSVIGAISQATSLPVTTAVTCPTYRISPVVMAQAAATSAVMLQGRFTFGVGSGEALNEHIHGEPWPSADVRLERLEEAVGLIPEHFEQVSELVTRESTARSVACGPDLAEHLETLQPALDAGFEDLYLGNMGPHFRQMIKVYGDEVLPELRSRAGA